MITSINDFKKTLNESLSVDRKQDFKLKLLIQTAKEMIDAKIKFEIAELKKKTANNELKEILQKLETHSIICNGVLIEMIDDYESSSIDFNGYEKFVADSLDILGEQYIEMHNKISEIATQISGKEYTRINKNTKNIPNGLTEGFGDTANKFINWIKGIKRSVMAFLNRSNAQIENIKSKLASIKSSQAFESKMNESGNVSKYATMIINALKKHGESSYLDILYNNNIAKGSGQDGSMYQNLIKLRNDGTITYRKVGNKFIYALANVNINSNAIIDVPDTDTTPLPNDALVEALSKASEAISHAEEEKFYEELYRTKQAQVISLLKEFKAKKIAIDDKIIQLITEEKKPKLSKSEYMDKMSNAEEVGEAIAEMAQSLFSMYSKTHSVSGSVRQYKDDSNSPDGTLGATFDYVFKTVKLPTNESDSFLTRVINKIKRFFSNFKIASKRMDMALSQI